jgi:hypothetical protein
VHRAAFIDGVAGDVEDAAENAFAHRHGNRGAGAVTGMPRLRPSHELMAMARTQPSPRCCWTSRTSLVATPFTSNSISSAS